MGKFILKVVLIVGSILCISLILLVSLNYVDNNCISQLVSKYSEAFRLIAGFFVLMGVLFSYLRFHQQETVIDLQNKNLKELKNNNQLLQYKNHIEHFRNNLKYIEAGYIENISIQTKSMVAYHNFYDSAKFGDFSLNSGFLLILSTEIEGLISLLTDYKSNIKMQNETLCRFVEICEVADRILSCIGMKCDLNVRTNDDDGRVFPFEVYRYISTCFKTLIVLFDGELGEWGKTAISFSNINYEITTDDSVVYDKIYEARDLDLLINCLNGKSG
ncbi:hypothetical protein [Colwellia sp. E2M01]|uniref:hypothetical protein n=1 Tax=Colwellia sp. E2M01 TaxID=2841561 RepID=UPI001C092E9C|nr:hypothetical protein [Colwellia sp. E2M01]MBU2870556.1 hypothetical protein [Colwellia sp. E2M01]